MSFAQANHVLAGMETVELYVLNEVGGNNS
jgi:hypothetical protein